MAYHGSTVIPPGWLAPRDVVCTEDSESGYYYALAMMLDCITSRNALDLREGQPNSIAATQAQCAPVDRDLGDSDGAPHERPVLSPYLPPMVGPIALLQQKTPTPNGQGRALGSMCPRLNGTESG